VLFAVAVAAGAGSAVVLAVCLPKCFSRTPAATRGVARPVPHAARKRLAAARHNTTAVARVASQAPKQSKWTVARAIEALMMDF